MASLSYVLKHATQPAPQNLGVLYKYDLVRWASKKASGSTQNRVSGGRPKHRTIKIHEGQYATAGSRLVTQLNLRFHPGLHVGFGKNGTLFALEAGRVMITCEKLDPKWDHTWIERIYGGHASTTIYKKFFNIIPDEQLNRFKLVDQV